MSSAKRNRPVDSLGTPRFAGVSTFFRLPLADTAEGLDMAVFGVPFDGGQSYRSGSRLAPSEIRRMSALIKPRNPSLDVSPYDYLNIADVGDAPVNPLDPDVSRKWIQESAAKVLEAGAMPVAVGGDHSITLPLLRAAAEKHGPLALVQVDAHMDVGDSYFGTKYGGGTPFRRALEEGLIRADKWIQIGIRGSCYVPDEYQFVRDHPEMRCLTEDRIRREGFDMVLNEVASLADTPCYFTFDIDGIDPAFAPGTGNPTIGGLTSWEAITLVRSLVKLPEIVAWDVVEVQPAYDVSCMTSIFAAQLTFEFLSTRAVCRREKEAAAMLPPLMRAGGGGSAPREAKAGQAGHVDGRAK